MAVKTRFYHTSHCHLCELALEVMRNYAPSLEYELVDIADNEALIASYGARIPVLAKGEAELDWPFDGQRLDAFIATS